MSTVSLNIPSFILGISEELEKNAKNKKRCWTGYEPVPGKKPYSEDSCRPIQSKKAVDLSSMPVNENIFPSSSTQLKWKYSRTPDKLRLSDGNLVYSFAMPSEFPEEDTPITRLDDEDLTNFEKDVLSKGSAQIHRSSPNSVYLTLADGANNPTFMLNHEKDKQWRYSPSKKFLEKIKKIKESLPENQTENVSVDVPSLMESAKDLEKVSYNRAITSGLTHASRGLSQQELAEKIENAAKTTMNYGNNALNFMANHPLESAFGGYLAAKGLHHLYNKFYKDPEDEYPLNNTFAAGLGLAPVITAKYIKGKYK
jgi:hypothetical protein